MKPLCLVAVILTSASVVSAEPPSQLKEANKYSISYFDFYMYAVNEKLDERITRFYNKENHHIEVQLRKMFEDTDLAEKIPIEWNQYFRCFFEGFTYSPDSEEFTLEVDFHFNFSTEFANKRNPEIYGNDISIEGELDRQDNLKKLINQLWEDFVRVSEDTNKFKGYVSTNLDQEKFNNYVIRNTKLKASITGFSARSYRDEPLTKFSQALKDAGKTDRFYKATRVPGSGRISIEIDDRPK